MIKNVAILSGGNSSEFEVSIKSAQNIFDSLQGRGYSLYMITVKGTDWSYIVDGQKYEVDKNDFSVTIGGKKVFFDYALIMIHGTPGENGLMPAYFEMLGIPHSTCGFTSAAVTFNKALCKKALAGLGIAMARELTFSKSDKIDPKNVVDTLGLPLFVKPDASGSSCGVTKVTSVEELLPAIDYAFSESPHILMEEFIEGREVACGTIITDRGGEQVFPITEIVSKRGFFDYQAKYNGFSSEITPADLPKNVVDRLRKDSLNIYKQLDCRGVVRADYIIKNDIPYFIEINTIPGMSSASIVPQQVAAIGLNLGDLWQMIIQQ